MGDRPSRLPDVQTYLKKIHWMHRTTFFGVSVFQSRAIARGHDLGAHETGHCGQPESQPEKIDHAPLTAVAVLGLAIPVRAPTFPPEQEFPENRCPHPAPFLSKHSFF
jgi:hypothetical protein